MFPSLNAVLVSASSSVDNSHSLDISDIESSLEDIPLISLCHALSDRSLGHKEVDEVNIVLKLVSKQELKKLEVDPRNRPV